MTEQPSPILVTGATGNTGRALIDALSSRGAPVRAMVRAEADRTRLPAGVEVAVAEDYAHYRRGEAAAVSPTVAEITGRPPTDMEQFARDYAPAFAS
jgi:nucleoside-diphosphate-sugar epimerase